MQVEGEAGEPWSPGRGRSAPSPGPQVLAASGTLSLVTDIKA